MDLTPKQQTSEAIRQADNILILTAQHPSVDQTTAVLALAAILRKFGKTATAVLSDNPPASVQALELGSAERNLGGMRDFVLKVDVTKAEVDKLRYEVQDGKLNIFLTPFRGNFAPSDVTFAYGEAAINYELVVVLGVPTRARIDRLYEQNATAFEHIPMVNLDFHRSNENYGAVNLIEPNASSLCEMLVALSESLQGGIIDAEIATALLMGIVASTDRFTAAHTSPKSLTVAAQMMAAGARQQAVVRALYRDGKSDNRGERGGSDRNDRDRGGRSGGERDRNNSERSERGSDRPDRSGSDRGERTSDRGERRDGSRDDRNRDQSQRQQSQPVSAPAQPLAQPQEAPESQPEQQSTGPEVVVAPAAVAMANEREYEDMPHTGEPVEPELPIIEPSHIEMSQLTESEAAAQSDDQAQSAQSLLQPETPAPSAPADRPIAMPMADFAAAAEIFADKPQTAQPDNDQAQS